MFGFNVFIDGVKYVLDKYGPSGFMLVFTVIIDAAFVYMLFKMWIKSTNSTKDQADQYAKALKEQSEGYSNAIKSYAFDFQKALEKGDVKRYKMSDQVMGLTEKLTSAINEATHSIKQNMVASNYILKTSQKNSDQLEELRVATAEEHAEILAYIRTQTAN